MQAQDWQQQLARQRLQVKFSMQRCGPSRSISMPSARQHYMLPLNRDKTSPQSIGQKPLDTLPSLTESADEYQQPSGMPVVRVPSSLSEVNINDAADCLKPGLSHNVEEPETSGSRASSQQSEAPTQGGKSRPARRRVTEGSLPAFKALQPLHPILSPAARSRTDTWQSAAMHKGAAVSKAQQQLSSNAASSKGQQQLSSSVAGKARSGQMVRGAALSARDRLPFSRTDSADNQTCDVRSTAR